MKEHKVGDTFRYGKILLKVVVDLNNTCDGCYFCAQRKGGRCGAIDGCCIGENRKDKTSVNYVLIE